MRASIDVALQKIFICDNLGKNCLGFTSTFMCICIKNISSREPISHDAKLVITFLHEFAHFLNRINKLNVSKVLRYLTPTSSIENLEQKFIEEGKLESDDCLKLPVIIVEKEWAIMKIQVICLKE